MEKIMKLAALMTEADKLAKEIIEEGREKGEAFRVIGASIWNGGMAVQIFQNLKDYGEKHGLDVVRINRDDDLYPYEDSFTIDGVKFFEILSDEEADDDAKLAV